MICVEAGLIGLAGAIIGWLLGHALAIVASAMLESQLGETINPLSVGWGELFYVVGVVVLSVVAGLVPAFEGLRDARRAEPERVNARPGRRVRFGDSRPERTAHMPQMSVDELLHGKTAADPAPPVQQPVPAPPTPRREPVPYATPSHGPSLAEAV